jgi:hypothetical protein
MKRQKTVTNVMDKTIVDRVVATDTKRETVTYTELLADGGVRNTVREQKVEVSHEESVRTSYITKAQSSLANLENGDLVTLLGNPGPKVLMDSWLSVNEMQHERLKAGGYPYPVMKDHHTVVDMINDNKAGVFNASTIFFECPEPNDTGVFTNGPVSPPGSWTTIVPYSSDLERFYLHGAAFQNVIGCENGNSYHPNPLLSRLPYSVYIDMLNSMATRKGHENFKHGGLFKKNEIVNEIWSIARTKAMLGVTDTMAERYQIKSAIAKDLEDNSRLDIDINELDTNTDNKTTCTFYVRGEIMLTWNTGVCVGRNDPYDMTLMFPQYRARFVGQARADSLIWVQDNTNRDLMKRQSDKALAVYLE